MKAVQFNQYGDPDVLRVVDVEAPHAGPGEVRIKVHAAGVNPFDWKVRAGYVQEYMPLTFPAGVGSEASGIVDEVGAGASGVSIGDAVFGFARNAVAEHAVLTSWAHKPETMPFEVAGGLPAIVETATRILDLVDAKMGETILVAGAAGGVGTALIQFARHRGITVIGTASTAKHDYLRDLGAIPTTYEPGLVARVHALAPQGVDAAFDLAGAGIIPDLVEIVGNPVRVVSIADVAAQQHGVVLTTSPQKHPEFAFDDAARLYSEGCLRLHIERTFPLEHTAQAQALSAEGRVTGKLVVTVA